MTRSPTHRGAGVIEQFDEAADAHAVDDDQPPTAIVPASRLQNFQFFGKRLALPHRVPPRCAQMETWPMTEARRQLPDPVREGTRR